ncbi:hypothetical protein, partial [uncultured Caballeronia sp.]|uniref:hypothetical protein n=1 Tax=uncultured Caballeronia sp. TaxID=1827198 RepID=UPI0035CACD36
EYCDQAAQSDRWCLATRGEAHFVLGNFDDSESFYRQALAVTNSPRERQSMYSQAMQIAFCFGDEQVSRIEGLFGVVKNSEFGAD